MNTPKSQTGVWTLTAPDGRTWQADTPLKAVSAEQRERVPPEVAVARIFAACNEADESTAQPALHNLRKRLAELHLYEEINEHYAKCNPGPENLRDWVFDRIGAQPVQPAPGAQGPKELWLQLHGDSDAELSEPVDYTDGVTWCWHSIHDSDVRYVRADLAQPAPDRDDTPESGMLSAPHYRGYANLGSGRYILNHTAELPAELIISIATEEEKADRAVGDSRGLQTRSIIQPDDMAVRLRFENAAGLDALEQQLQFLREEFFPETVAAIAQPTETEGDAKDAERYLEKCQNASRCIHGCLASESCYYTRAALDAAIAQPAAETQAEPVHTHNSMHWVRTCPACNESIDYTTSQLVTQKAPDQAVVLSEQLYKSKRLIIEIYNRLSTNDPIRQLIETRTGAWFVWGVDRDATATPTEGSQP